MGDEKKRVLDFWMYEWKDGERRMRWKYVGDANESCRLIPETLSQERLAAILQEEFAGDITLDERGWVHCNCVFNYPAPTALQNSFTWRGGVIRCEGCAEKDKRIAELERQRDMAIYERDEARYCWCGEHESNLMEEGYGDPWEAVRKAHPEGLEADAAVEAAIYRERWKCEPPTSHDLVTRLFSKE